MKKYRTLINVMSFLVLSSALVYLGAQKFIIQQAAGPKLAAEFSDSAGIAPRNDVTIRGIVVGSVDQVDLTDTGVLIEMILDPGTEVPEGTLATIVRRSPIGELTIELEPGAGPPLEDGATIAVDDTVPPPDVSRTIEALADVLHAVPSEDLSTVISELSLAVEGRAGDLARFSEASALLPERLLEIESELSSLIRNGPKLSGVLADNAKVLADDITQTALLADILRDQRFELLSLYRKGGEFSRVAADLLAEQKPNISCLLDDFGTVNLALEARTDDLAAALETNHFFFDGAEQAVQKDREGYTWFRVQLLPHTEPAARTYAKKRPAPDVYPGRACESRYGPGVGPATQGKVVLAPDSAVRK